MYLWVYANFSFQTLSNGDLLIGAGYANGHGGLVFRCEAENEHGKDSRDTVFIEMGVGDVRVFFSNSSLFLSSFSFLLTFSATK